MENGEFKFLHEPKWYKLYYVIVMLNVHVFVQPFPNKQTLPKADAYEEIIIVGLISVFENCKQSFWEFFDWCSIS